MTMSIRRGAAALAAVALLALPVVAQADNKHVHADAAAQHAEEALKHAQAAGVKNPHLDEGIKELKESVAHGKAGHADVAAQHADAAVMHLSEVK
jgi:LPS O-antigen subunit length determinant protein (WzzB/FepE family)